MKPRALNEKTNHKVLFVSNVVAHVKAFHIPYMKWFCEQGWDVHVISNAGEEDELPYCKRLYNIPICRSPYNLRNIIAYKMAKKVISDEHYDIIHCHTPMGGIIARLASRKERKNGTKVIYTAHGFHFYKGASFINWLLFFTTEWLMARYTDVLIAINHEDYARAQKFHAKQVKYVPGIGVDVRRFSPNGNKSAIRAELGIPENSVLLLSVGELNSNKNHQAIIRALAKLKNEKLQYVVIGEGSERARLEALIIQLGLEGKIHLPGYRKNTAPIYKAADVFCLPSKREGLCVSLMEAMASGLPCIVSDIRGNRDLIMPKKGGCLFNFEQVDSIVSAIQMVASDSLLKKAMGSFNSQFVLRFSSKVAIETMKRIYWNR